MYFSPTVTARSVSRSTVCRAISSARSCDAASVKVIGARRYLVAQFPWRNRLSFMVGYMKVDPALARYRDAHGYKKVEAIALNDGDTIVYMQPVVRL